MDKGKLFNNGNYYIYLDKYEDKRLAIRLKEEDIPECIPEHPELVDIKLTDVCHIGCAWCYQDSVSESLHGDLDMIKNVISSLNPKITEVAFGGGDVLQHPHIEEILKYSRECGITSSNITMNWQSVVKYPEQVKLVMPLLDAIGVSITGKGQIFKVVEILKELNFYDPSKICFHIIPDIYSTRIIEQILLEIHTYSPESDILLLGYKTIGRGDTFTPKMRNRDDLMSIVELMEALNISYQFDTKFTKDYLDIIKEVAIPISYNIKEGEFSMNIDCVEGFYSQSSYNLDFKGKIEENFNITEAFAKVREYGNMETYRKEVLV